MTKSKRETIFVCIISIIIICLAVFGIWHALKAKPETEIVVVNSTVYNVTNCAELDELCTTDNSGYLSECSGVVPDCSCLFVDCDHGYCKAGECIDADEVPDDDDVPDDEAPDNDGDGVPDDEDEFPDNPDEQGDNDGDGVGDNEDTDDDNDGVIDEEDDYPNQYGQTCSKVAFLTEYDCMDLGICDISDEVCEFNIITNACSCVKEII